MKSAPILIIDKLGLIGEYLSTKLSREFPVVFVSRSPFAQVPFSGKFPVIPDGKYSHIVFIQGQDLGLEFAPQIIEKAKNINAEFIFAQGLSPKSEYFSEKVLKLYSTGKVIIYGDIFDDKSVHRQNFKSVINKFLYQAQKFGNIQIAGDGLNKAYPVLASDVADGLIDVIFGVNKSNYLFYIFPHHSITELSLAHMIQKANPEIGIDFVKPDLSSENISYPLNGKNLLDDKYPLAKKIRKINIKTIKITEYKGSDKPQRRKRKFLFFAVWILVIFTLCPFLFTLIFSFFGLQTLYLAKTEIERGDMNNVKSSIHLSNTFFYLGKKTSSILFFHPKRLEQDLDLGYKISDALLQAVNAENYFVKVFNGSSKNPADDFAKAENNLKNAVIAFERIRAEGKIPTISPILHLLSTTSDVMSGIFGMEGEKTYLILFQDNMEIRPGGGVIDYYGILKLNMGKITDFSIHDVSDADGQLRGHVEPPFAIRRYVPLEHWYLRDSNFDVDFTKSASASSNFLYIETGQKVSGVIGVDTSFVKGILKAIGSEYSSDYKKAIMEMQAKLASGNISYLSIIHAVSDALLQKHLIFWFNNNLQNIFTVNGWSSALWDERKEGADTINDFLGINEANLGSNKVNNLIYRQVSQKVTVNNDRSISEELSIAYKNASAEDYKNYLRIILPKDSQIFSISMNNIKQPIIDAITDPQIYGAKNFKKPLGLEVEKTTEENKTIYGFLVNVPVGGITKIKAEYTLPKKAFNINAFSYSLKLFKQPGIDSIPYSFSISFPANLNITNVYEGIISTQGKAIYSEKIIKDKNLNINFSRK